MKSADALIAYVRTMPAGELRARAKAYAEVGHDPATRPADADLYLLFSRFFAEALYRQDIDFARLGDSIHKRL